MKKTTSYHGNLVDKTESNYHGKKLVEENNKMLKILSNKKFKKEGKIMKKFLAVLMLFFVLGFGLFQKVYAGDVYSVTVTTYDVTGSTINFALGAYPNISGRVDLGLLVISVSSNTVYVGEPVAQTITIYENATSTSAASSLITFTVPNTYGFYHPIGVTGLNYNYKIRIEDIAIKKSSVNSTVNATFIYR